MKKAVAAIAFAVAFACSQAHADKIEKIAYPTADKPSFIISVPKSWKMTPAEDEGDYFHLEAASGAVFSFRTIEGSEKSLDKAIKATLADIGKRFDDVEIGDAQDWKPSGLTGLYAVGTAKEKDDGAPIKIGVGWCALNDGKIAEMWFIADADDAAGLKQAEDIANSLTAPSAEEESDSSSDN